MLKARKADRLARLLSMIEGRMSHREMARALGISKTQVTRDIQTILDDLTVSNREAAERLSGNNAGCGSYTAYRGLHAVEAKTSLYWTAGFVGAGVAV